MGKSMPRGYQLIKAIRKEKEYKNNVDRRDKASRKVLEDSEYSTQPTKMILGGLYLMEYFEPKTKEDLEYYDAQPCAIMFGKVRNKDGQKRILCFNIHYYPPRIRFKVMDKIMEIYKDFYSKHWETKKPRGAENTSIDYSKLLKQLEAAKLDFGVRMYIPDLIGHCWYVTPDNWSKAVFTEGRFKKRTREAILHYWKNKKG